MKLDCWVSVFFIVLDRLDVQQKQADVWLKFLSSMTISVPSEEVCPVIPPDISCLLVVNLHQVWLLCHAATLPIDSTRTWLPSFMTERCFGLTISGKVGWYTGTVQSFLMPCRWMNMEVVAVLIIARYQKHLWEKLRQTPDVQELRNQVLESMMRVAVSIIVLQFFLFFVFRVGDASINRVTVTSWPPISSLSVMTRMTSQQDWNKNMKTTSGLDSPASSSWRYFFNQHALPKMIPLNKDTNYTSTAYTYNKTRV